MELSKPSHREGGPQNGMLGYGSKDITFGLEGTPEMEFRGKKANRIGLMECVKPQMVRVDPPQ